MAEDHVCGQYTTREIFEIRIPEMSFPAFWASKLAPKFMLTLLVFEIKDGKNAQKVKKNINCNLSLLIRGIIRAQKIFEIWNTEMLFPAFWASKK